MRIICAQRQRSNLFVLQTKKRQFLLSFAVLTGKKYVKKSKVALLHSNASFLRCFVYHCRILVNVHGELCSMVYTAEILASIEYAFQIRVILEYVS